MVVMKQPHTITNIIHLNTIIVRLFTLCNLYLQYYKYLADY
jgi:hypothetical protein